MIDLILADFETQFDASAAAERLISYGLQREQVVLQVDESVGRSAASASAPTTEVSAVSHTGKQDHDDKATLRAPTHTRDPAQVGHATIAVELHGELTVQDAQNVLADAGACSIRLAHREIKVHERAAIWPTQGNASHKQVKQAVDAARGGAALSPTQGERHGETEGEHKNTSERIDDPDTW